MRECATNKCFIAVSALEHTDDSPSGIPLGKFTGVPSEAMVEGGGDVVTVAGHIFGFVFGGIEAGTKTHMTGAEYYARDEEVDKTKKSLSMLP